MPITDVLFLGEKEVNDFNLIKKEITRVDVETEIYYKGVRLPSDFDELLEELRTADGYFDRLLINNKEVAKLLEDEGCASKNARGSYGYKSIEKIDALLEKYYDIVNNYIT